MLQTLEILIFLSPALIGLTIHLKGQPTIGICLTIVGLLTYLIMHEMARLNNF